jgi:hypothetical protein
MSDQRKMNESSLSPQQWHDENLRLADELEAFANDKLRAGFAVFGPTKLRALAAHLRTRPSETADEAGEPDGFEYGFEVYEVRGDDRLQVAAGFGPDAQSMREEANHYAAQYAQDGPVEVFLTTRWPLSPALADGHAGVEFTATLPVAQGEREAAEDEHPAARRIREQFDRKYGDLSGFMRCALAWRSAWEDFRRPYNMQMERPVTEEIVEQAERGMLLAVRGARAVLAAAGKEKP